MSQPPAQNEPLQPLLDAEAGERLSRRLENAAWGCFFLWMAAIWYSDLSWYWGMVGIGVIFLGEAVVRGFYELKISGVAVTFGILFLAGGIWGLATTRFAILPALFVLFGIAMVWRAIMSWVKRT
jgi:hypothetical protein